MDDRLIPFGKYKGKPVEVLATDKDYTDWLLAQSWFKEKNINLYTIIVNNFREPVDTPDHNSMQIKFLDIEYRLKFAYYLDENFFQYNCESINKILKNELETNTHKKEIAYALRNQNDSVGFKSRDLLSYSDPSFETVDTSFWIEYGVEFNFQYIADDYYKSKCIDSLWLIKRKYFQIEIKPTISDDYPAVLRQMKASMPTKSNVWSILFLRKYTGVGATVEQFRKYFKTQGYIVIFEDEIDNIELPDYDLELRGDGSAKPIIDYLLK